MINIQNKQDCCGCSACVQRCPKQCISLHEDEEGFLYPKVNLDTCIDCGLCEKVCPVLYQAEERVPLEVFAAKNPNEQIRMESSSGGVFTQLAELTINAGGVVFGVKWNEYFEAVHAYTETKDGLADFRGSKYVQSFVGDTFKQAEQFLKQGRQVLFSGTPCQIASFKKYLRKEYGNLLTVDLVCHGVPSPKIWKEYLQSLRLENIGYILHKDKSTGWREYSLSMVDKNKRLVFTENASKNKFMMNFISNLILRPSCFSCPAKSGKSGADITLADFWGIEHVLPQMDDNKGTSLVCCNTLMGQSFLEQLNSQLVQSDYQQAVLYNSCMVKSTYEPMNRQQFWHDYYEKGINALFLLKHQRQNILKRIIKRIFK